MAQRSFLIQAIPCLLMFVVGALVSGCAAFSKGRVVDAACTPTSVVFVGFGEGPANIEQNGTMLWQGQLADYDPSTDLSGGTQLCADAGRDLILHAGGKAYRAPLPETRPPYFVLVDFRTNEPTVQRRPILLD